eukprot:NODE_6498_length_878_cov_99.165563_g5903_i0.p1 GENE.NODE_6498_length_878_cov_99.165563_g5903_i0~~NODE_6498_length_878_cov_99.165563_g5903_i0.p1  ORF type:complete len:225 (-),score=46.81 NODE_6498_length_878_cov_99.165563_g5903_i0:148-822(-)
MTGSPTYGQVSPAHKDSSTAYYQDSGTRKHFNEFNHIFIQDGKGIKQVKPSAPALKSSKGKKITSPNDIPERKENVTTKKHIPAPISNEAPRQGVRCHQQIDQPPPYARDCDHQDTRKYTPRMNDDLTKNPPPYGVESDTSTSASIKTFSSSTSHVISHDNSTPLKDSIRYGKAQFRKSSESEKRPLSPSRFRDTERKDPEPRIEDNLRSGKRCVSPMRDTRPW